MYQSEAMSDPSKSNAAALKLKIHGMDCADEIATLRREVGRELGDAARLSFDLLDGTMSITGTVEPEAIVRAVARTGMKAEVVRGDVSSGREKAHEANHSRDLSTLLSGAFLILGFSAHALIAGGVREAVGNEGLGHHHTVPIVGMVSYFVSILLGVRFVLPKAWFAARRLRPDMNLLMTVAVLGAIVLGEWFEAATVAFLFALSLTLESWSVGRARRAVAALLTLTPPTARVRTAHGEESLPIEVVAVGSRVIVRPGERFPLDGVVASGVSAVNQAPITGESLPVVKEAGGAVFAGSINGDGALEIVTTKPANDTTLARIIRMVRDAQSKRASAEQWVEHFARIYTPAVMVLALGFFLLPPLLGMGTWALWSYRALVLLVIACPCALVISTPVSIVAALASAARAGVLIKGGVFMELPAKLKAIAFDKTGTITQGRLEVASVVALGGHSEREVVERAAALEQRSTHPLAKAIVAFANAQGIVAAPADDLTLIAGKGATGRIGGRNFWVGSHRYLEERGQEEAVVHAALERMSAVGHTVVVVGNERHVCGLIALKDAPRPGASGVLVALRQAGVSHLVLLTGDNRGTADAIRDALHFDEVQAELLPEDKVRAIEQLVQRYGAVAMVGDGVNDAPAMAIATLGIAMGAAGSDAAIETADIALMSDDLARLPWLIAHSRRTVAIIRQNISFALLVKTTFVVLAFVGRATLWSAIAADMGATFLVILNALRLLSGPSSLGTHATAGPARRQHELPGG